MADSTTDLTIGKPVVPALNKLTFNIDEGLPQIFEKVNKFKLPYTFEIIKSKIVFTFTKPK